MRFLFLSGANLLLYMLAFTRKVTQTSARILEKESPHNSSREGLFHLKSLLDLALCNYICRNARAKRNVGSPFHELEVS